jgi:anti-anti-sigma regulatory factor
MRKALLKALRLSDAPVIVDLAHCPTLNCDDIDLLLDCLAQAVGHSTKLILVAVSPAVRVLLDVIRVSSLVPVVSSLEEALNVPRRSEVVQFKETGAAPSSLAWSA